MIIVMDSLKDILAKNIERLIEASGRSVRDIASEIKVSDVSIHRWKSGANPPDVVNMEALAKALNVDPMEFYKSESNIVPLYGNTALRKFLILPDDIVEDLSALSPDPSANVWENIRIAIEEERQYQQSKKKNVTKKA